MNRSGSPARPPVRAVIFDAGNTLLRMNYAVIAEHLGTRGRATSPPPQLGQMPWSRPSAQDAQKVHSKEQIIAAAAAGRSASQHSQLGRSSSMGPLRQD